MDRVRKRAFVDSATRFKKSRYEGKPTKTVLPIFESSGLLELESNNKEGVQLKHIEPSDAQSPNDYWNELKVPIRKRNLFQLIVYKKGEKTPIGEYDLGPKSSYIVGRAFGESAMLEKQNEDSKKVILADIGIPEETCSKQHCVLQFRKKNGVLKAYVMDLNSSNGTSLNSADLPRARYVELRSGDVIVPSCDDDSEYELIYLCA